MKTAKQLLNNIKQSLSSENVNWQIVLINLSNIFDDFNEYKKAIDILNEVCDANIHGYPVYYTGERDFEGYSDIDEIIISDYVNKIGDYAFQDCTSLNKIYIGKNVNSIGMLAFAGCINLNFEIPDSISNFEVGAFAGSGLTKLSVKEGISAIPKFLCKDCQNLIEVNLPPSIVEIRDGAFSNTNINNINAINVRIIGENAFFNCDNLSKVQASNKLTKIGDAAFANCAKLQYLNTDNVSYLGEYPFYGCSNLKINLQNKFQRNIYTIGLDEDKINFI